MDQETISEQKPEIALEETTSAHISPETESNVKLKDSDVDLQKQLNLEPTTIVLAKVKGYRAWPAMVLDETILPENIRKMKPKSIRLARKPTTPVIVVPVRFFSDDTYIWIKSCDLKVLPKADIEAFLLKRANAKKHDTLIDAYKLAQSPPDMREFNTWGSSGPPQYSESADESISEESTESEEPEKKKLKLTIKLKNPSASRSKSASKKASSAKKTASKPASKSASKATSKSALKATPKSARASSQGQKNGTRGVKEESVSEEEEPDSGTASDSQEGFDFDWGLEEANYDPESGNYIFDDEQQQREFFEQFPRATDLSLILEQYQETFKKIHNAISPLLLSEDLANEKAVVNKLREVERLLAKADTPLIAFTKSPLFRVLLLTMHRPQDRFAHPFIRDVIQRILSQLNIDACQVTEEDMILHTKDNTPLPSDSRAEAEAIAVD